MGDSASISPPLAPAQDDRGEGAPSIRLVVIVACVAVALAIALAAAVAQSLPQVPFRVALICCLALAVPLPLLIASLMAVVRMLDRNVALLRRSQSSLKESEERFRRLSDATGEGVVVHDHGIVLEANRTFARMFGYEMREILGKFGPELTAAPESRGLITQRLRDYVEEPYEIVAMRKDGARFPALVSAKVCSYHGKSVRVSTFQDLTDQRKAEKALCESEARLNAAIENLPVVFWAIGMDGRYIMANTVCAERWGDLIGKRPEDIGVDPGTLALWLDNNRRAFSGETVKEEVELATDDGKKGCFYNIITPIRDGDGIRGILGVNIDITERKRAEAEATRRRHEALQQRTESLAVTGRLAAGIAHEINNPLQGIKAQLRLLMDELPEEVREGKRIEYLNSGINQIAWVVAKLLDLHRHGEDAEPVSQVSRVLADVTGFISSQLARRRISIESEVTPRNLSLPMSPKDLTQVLLNLILNAQDAMPDGGVVRVQAEETENAKTLCVTDEGIGVPDDDKAKLFSPFYTTKGPEGTGLGLSVCHVLVTEAGGEIDVDSPEGKGARINITFPAA